MARTTPPRPADLVGLFPELASYATPAIRLHPRHGAPGPGESSVGGPLLWPAAEAWPTCGEPHSECIGNVQRLDDVWAARQIMDRFEEQRRADPTTYRRTKEEQAALDEVAWRLVDPESIDAAGPPSMYPVFQLYRRDVPWFLGPDDADLLQVLWCPLTHAPEYLPRVILRWRRAADVMDPVDTGPLLPCLAEDPYVPNPCLLDPEPIIDYPPSDELPPALEERVVAWGNATWPDASVAYARYNLLATVPGWKIGGCHDGAEVAIGGPFACSKCGEPQRLLLAIEDLEWASNNQFWRPIEDPPEPAGHDTGVWVGGIKVHYCPASPDHPPVLFSQGP